MLLIGQTPRLKIDNFLSPLVQTFNDDEDLVVMVEQMISKLQFIAKMHGLVFDNVNQAQVR
jgi:hypothetical protein